MLQGLSTPRACDDSAAELAASGRQFVFRYHSRATTTPRKRLSPREAAELARAGLQLATVYQDQGRAAADFGFERGLLDGAAAQEAAGVVGQPPGSAIYFAVDADFGTQELHEFVVPYFHGVRQGMDRAAGGISAYDVGIRGSGLACGLVRDGFALARYAWLAQARDWRGSSAYVGWDVRELGATGPLCTLGTDWQACEARHAFGQFQPVGFVTRAGEGELRWVSASQLNLRSAPSTASHPPLTQLPEGQEVRVLGGAGGPWLRVRTTLAGTDLVGYAHGGYLAREPRAAYVPAPLPAGAVPAVHYRPGDPDSRRSSTARRAQPLGEPGAPRRDPAAPTDLRLAQLAEIVEWLDVECSARYQPDGVTFCNVYAADFCHLAGAYLPRTWWTGPALMAIARGETPDVAYGRTVRELRADDLYAWLAQFGPAFGWRRVFDATALQAAANAGGLGVIVADRLQQGRPGHISVVVPETAQHRAVKDADGHVLLPLQSQAGLRCVRYGTLGRAWWNDEAFADEDGFFVHD